jgi:hypothetical protein
MRSDSSRAGRQHDDGHAAGGRRGAQGPADLEAVAPGQHEVQQDQIGHALPDRLQSLVSGMNHVSRVPGAGQVPVHELRDVVIVLDDEDAAHGMSIPAPTCSAGADRGRTCYPFAVRKQA